MKHRWLLEIPEGMEMRVIPDFEEGLVAMIDFLESEHETPKAKNPCPGSELAGVPITEG